MSIISTRPKLVSFRALALHGDNPGLATGTDDWTFKLTQDIDIGLAVPLLAGGILQAVVKIELRANASNTQAGDQTALFSAAYEAKFDYPTSATEAELAPLFGQESYQYGLVAQAFPLAMTHFRRELQSMGFDARRLPLGL